MTYQEHGLLNWQTLGPYLTNQGRAVPNAPVGRGCGTPES